MPDRQRKIIEETQRGIIDFAKDYLLFADGAEEENFAEYALRIIGNIEGKYLEFDGVKVADKDVFSNRNIYS